MPFARLKLPNVSAVVPAWTMTTPQQRVHPRYQVDLHVTMKWRRASARVPVYDVSQGGIFAITSEQPSIRELIRLEFELPGVAEPLSLHGMAVNLVQGRDSDGRPEGVGIQFYAVDRETQRIWSQYIERVRREATTKAPEPRAAIESAKSEKKAPLQVARPLQPTPPTRSVAPVDVDELPPMVIPAPMPRQVPAAKPASAPLVAANLVAPVAPVAPVVPVAPVAPAAKPVAPIDFNLPPTRISNTPPTQVGPTPKGNGRERRKYRRYDAELDLEVQSEDEMYLFYARDVSAGGMFICTDLDVAIGASLVIHIRHPQYNEVFSLEAVVRRLSDSDEELGLGVEFVNMNDAHRRELLEFIGPSILGERGAWSGEHGAYDVEEHEENFVDESEAAYDGTEEPQNDQAMIANVFEPWTGASERQFWSRPPPEDEIDGIFNAFGSHDPQEGSREASLVPSNEVVPDFRLSVPSWDQSEFTAPPSEEMTYELSSIDAVPIEPEEVSQIEARRPATAAARPPARTADRAR